MEYHEKKLYFVKLCNLSKYESCPCLKCTILHKLKKGEEKLKKTVDKGLEMWYNNQAAKERGAGRRAGGARRWTLKIKQ